MSAARLAGVTLALTLLGPAASQASPPAPFSEVAAEAGLAFRHWNGMTGQLYYSEVLGSGAALFDFDGDGDLDLFLVQGNLLSSHETAADALVAPAGPLPLSGRLYRNDTARGGALHFSDVTERSGIRAGGYGMGVATGDFDNDGHVDLYVTNLGSNQLWRNQGDGSFRDVTIAAGADDRRWSSAAAFLDYDRDGWLDLFVVNYVDFTAERHKPCFDGSSARVYCGPASYTPQPARLLRNRGDGTFEDVSERTGIVAEAGAGLGIAVDDFDRDGWPDVFVANDGGENFLWRNHDGRRFRQEALVRGCALGVMGRAKAGMGVGVADVDGDGHDDLLVTNLEGEGLTLFAGDGAGNFEDRSVAAGLHAPSLPFTSFGAGFLDYDRDGAPDLLVVSGAIRRLPELVAAGDPFPLHQPNQLYHNRGDGRLLDASAEAGAAFRLSEVSRAAAFGDLDDDGDTDVVLTNNNGPVRLLRNDDASGRHWLGLRLLGGPGRRRDSLGARVAVLRPGRTPLRARAHSEGSYLSASDPRVLVGLGDAAAPVTVRVRWPEGDAESFGPLLADRYHALVQGEGSAISLDTFEAAGAPEPQAAARAARAARAAGTPALAGSALEALPEPALAGLEARVAEQLRTARQRIDVDAPGRAAAFGELARTYHVYGLLEPAAAAYRNARRLDRASHRWAYLLGLLELDRGRLEPAARALAEALALAPRDVPTQVRLAQAHLRRGEVQAARQLLEQTLRQDPSVALAHQLLAEAALAERQGSQAAAHVEAALRLQPQATELYHALALAHRANGDTEQAARALRRRGQGRVELRDPLALDLQTLQRSARWYGELGQSALQAGRAQEAERLLRRALEIDPQDPVAHLNLGVALTRLQRPAEALREIEIVLAGDPGHAGALFNRGVLRAAAGHDGLAMQDYRQALARDAELVDAHFNLANALTRQRDCGTALAHWQRAAQLDPGRVPARLGAIFCLARLGRASEARQRAEQDVIALENQPELGEALARLLATQREPDPGDGGRALELARGALRARGITAARLETLAMANAAAGNFPAAIADQKHAIVLAERSGTLERQPQLLLNLARYERREAAERPWPDALP